MGKGSKTLGKIHPVPSPRSSRGAGDPVGGWDRPTNPSWPGERRSPAGCAAPPPALERVLAGALPPPAHVPEPPRVSRQWRLTTSNMGLSKPLSPAGTGDAGSSALSQGQGWRRAGSLGRDLGVTCPHPTRPSSSPNRNPVSARGGWENTGAKFQVSLKWAVSILSQGKAAQSSRNH